MNAKESNMSDDIKKAELEAKKYVEDFKNTQLNIAVTGESGSGKSTFVNALRGMKNSDDGAAPTGVVETTTKPGKYPHPVNPNVILWDLPGIGTTKFPADRYLEHVEFKTYDFFIIVSNDRFKENDAKLAQEIKKMGKKFYFVRSKMDNSLWNAQSDQREYDEEKTIQIIRQYCKTGLEEQGVKDPQVFLLSSVYLHLYDFTTLQETLERELPSIKRDLLILALPNISSSIITKKKEVFRSQIKYFALLSACVAAVPVPGLSLAADIGILVGVLIDYLKAFRLDEKSLKKVSSDTNTPLGDLQFKSPFSGKEVTRQLVLLILKSSASILLAMAAEEGLRLIPFVGSMIAASISFITTSLFLNNMLDSLSDDAEMVLQKVVFSVARKAFKSD